MAFPTNPTNGQQHTEGGRVYQYNGTNAWELVGNVASHVHAAADITSGTLADARLSANVVLTSALADLRHQGAASLDVPDRATVGTSNTLTSGAIYWAFFTPTRTITVSQIAYASGATGATSVTLARMGLYTADSSGNATLVARTASDTTLSASGSTVYTRSLDTTGGYPATYTLNAGTRYGAALIVVATGAGSIATCNALTSVSTLSPRIQGVRTGNSDLVTSQTSAQYNGSTSWIPWFRMS